MLEHLKNLTQLYGISGNEDNIREYIISNIKGECAYHVDNLGNIIAFKKGMKSPKKKIMISAHMDEVGLIITHINPDGTLAFECVGGINDNVIAGRQVFLYNKGIYGVVGSKAVHNMTAAERKEKISVSKLYIDIGASDQKEAESMVSPGECVSFISGYTELGGGKVCSKALDDRIGCAIMLDLINDNAEYDIYLTFTVQEELGLRGAYTAAFGVEPDYAIVVETTTASDIPGSDGARRVCTLGDGAVVSFMDRRTFYDRELFNLAFSVARENSLKCQTKTLIAGGNDAGAIHLSRNGVRTIAVSSPCRYLHSPASVADYSDIVACELLIRHLITRILEL